MNLGFKGPVMYIKFWLHKASLPVVRTLLRGLCFTEKYGRYKLGKCCFFGPPDFLALCAKATEQLKTLDEALYESLLKQKLIFWYDPKGNLSLLRHFGISESYILWREQGIISCVIYTHFEAKFMYDRRNWHPITTQPLVMRQKCFAAVRAWLEAHSFPAELIECFD